MIYCCVGCRWPWVTFSFLRFFLPEGSTNGGSDFLASVFCSAVRHTAVGKSTDSEIAAEAFFSLGCSASLEGRR